MIISIRNIAITCALLTAAGFSTASHAQRTRFSDAPPSYFAREQGRNPGNNSEGGDMSLNEAVSMVQGRFNATAVKTDTVTESGQLIYRIRLLSADKSRVWTVSVDARTGRIY
ncbi:MAG: PepSY domain-containing protein [Steroidobacteraceae bacterium]